MAINIDYGPNPGVYGMAAFQAGQNKYRQQQQAAYLPFLRDAKQFQRQEYLTRLELEQKQQATQAGLLRAQGQWDQQQLRWANQDQWKLIEEQGRNKRAADAIEGRKKVPGPVDPRIMPPPPPPPVDGANPPAQAQLPPPAGGANVQPAPQPVPGQAPQPAAQPPAGPNAGPAEPQYISWMNATPQQRVTIRGQQRVNQRNYRQGRSPRFPLAEQGYLQFDSIAELQPFANRRSIPYHAPYRPPHFNDITGKWEAGVAGNKPEENLF